MKNFLAHMIQKKKEVLRVIGKRNLFLLITAVFVTILSVLFSDAWLQAAREESMELTKLNKSALEIAQLKINLLEAESAQRGYMLTNSEEYIEPYDQAVKNAASNINNIRGYFHAIDAIKDFEKESKLLVNLSDSISAKVAEMDLTLKFIDEGKLREAKKVINLDEGLIEMKKFSTDSDALLLLLNKKISESFKQRRLKNNIARASTIISPLILLALVILIIKQLIEELSKKAALQVTLADEILKHRKELEEKGLMLQNLSLEYQSDVEKEKYKLAREIHDELGSILTATKMDVSWVIKSLKDSQPEITDKLHKTKQYIDQGISFKRQIVQDLHPSTIASFGFWPALTSLIEDATERGGWKLSLTLPEEDTKLNDTIGLVIYRIVQETLNNAIKYAKAEEMSVHIIHDAQQIKLEIQDNGIGTDIDDSPRESHGMSGMQNRVSALGGHMEFTSKKGQGFFTLVMLPLESKSSK